MTIVTVGFGFAQAATADPCKVLREVDLQLKALAQKKLKPKWPSEGDDPPYDHMRAALDRVPDKAQYRVLKPMFLDVLSEAEAGRVHRCCGVPPRGYVQDWLCTVAGFLRDKDELKLARNAPVDSRGIAVLWDLSGTLGAWAAEDVREKLPAAFPPLGFGEYVIGRLNSAMWRDSDPAMRKFLAILLKSDGAYTELLVGHFADLLRSRPEVVLSRWAAIKPVAGHWKLKAVGETERLDINELLPRYEAACRQLKASSETCRDVHRFLRSVSTPDESREEAK